MIVNDMRYKMSVKTLTLACDQQVLHRIRLEIFVYVRSEVQTIVHDI